MEFPGVELPSASVSVSLTRPVGFSETEAKAFVSIVEQMMRAKEGRKKMKKTREKKPPKMKRAELLKRLLLLLEVFDDSKKQMAEELWVPPYKEIQTLLMELRKVVK